MNIIYAFKSSLTVSLLLMLTCGFSQDMHLTNYQANSPFFNPAASGDFKGFLKAGASVRSQYSRTYEQGLLNADANFFSPFHKKHWISAGIQLLYDRAGVLRIGQTGGGVQSAYHMPLGKKGNDIISAGVQLANYHLSANTDAYVSENTISGLRDPDLSVLSDFNASLVTLGAGVTYKRIVNKKSEWILGMAVMNINRPSFRLLEALTSMDLRYNANIGFRQIINKQFTIMPAVFYSYTEHYGNTNLQFTADYKLKPKNTWAIRMGLNHRVGESLSLLAGYSAHNVMACLGMDILTGAVSGAIANPGALELSMFYIFNRYTKPDIVPIVHCPKL
jgi:type IX secretion system PorP/SprF family membrane protein